MKIIIVGDGKVGMILTEYLSLEGHDIMVIDNNPEVVEHAINAFDVMGLSGNGANYNVLIEAGATKADLLIAATSSDEMNILSCLMAKKIGTRHTIARVRNPEYAQQLVFIREELGLSMIVNPEFEAAQEISRVLRFPSAIKLDCFSKGRVDLAEIRLPENGYLAGHRLSEWYKICKEKILICAVQRDDEVYIPNGTFVLKSGDKVGVITLRKEAHRVLSAIGHTKISVKNVMIIGAGKVSNYLAKILLATRHSVKLIDIDPEVCEEVCEVLPDNATVVCGNGMSQELLTEEGLDSADAIVALTGRDEDNILISVYSAGKNVPKVILKVNSDELTPIAENLGLNSIISPRKIVADVMVKYARALENSMGSTIETLYSLCGGRAEAVEFKIMDDFEYAGVPLKEMKLSSGVLIAGISREKDDILPSGDDVILPGDRVIIIAGGKRILSLSDIFAG